MAGLQIVRGGHKTGRRKSPGHNRQTQNLTDLRSITAAIKQVNRFTPNLANLCAPLRPLLKKDDEWNWQEKGKKTFNKMKEA